MSSKRRTSKEKKQEVESKDIFDMFSQDKPSTRVKKAKRSVKHKSSDGNHLKEQSDDFNIMETTIMDSSSIQINERNGNDEHVLIHRVKKSGKNKCMGDLPFEGESSNTTGTILTREEKREQLLQGLSGKALAYVRGLLDKDNRKVKLKKKELQKLAELKDEATEPSREKKKPVNKTTEKKIKQISKSLGFSYEIVTFSGKSYTVIKFTNSTGKTYHTIVDTESVLLFDSYKRITFTNGYVNLRDFAKSNLPHYIHDMIVDKPDDGEDGHSADHKNRIRTDNRLENLEYVNQSLQNFNRGRDKKMSDQSKIILDEESEYAEGWDDDIKHEDLPYGISPYREKEHSRKGGFFIDIAMKTSDGEYVRKKWKSTRSKNVSPRQKLKEAIIQLAIFIRETRAQHGGAVFERTVYDEDWTNHQWDLVDSYNQILRSCKQLNIPANAYHNVSTFDPILDKYLTRHGITERDIGNGITDRRVKENKTSILPADCGITDDMLPPHSRPTKQKDGRKQPYSFVLEREPKLNKLAELRYCTDPNKVKNLHPILQAYVAKKDIVMTVGAVPSIKTNKVGSIAIMVNALFHYFYEGYKALMELDLRTILKPKYYGWVKDPMVFNVPPDPAPVLEVPAEAYKPVDGPLGLKVCTRGRRGTLPDGIVANRITVKGENKKPLTFVKIQNFGEYSVVFFKNSNNIVPIVIDKDNEYIFDSSEDFRYTAKNGIKLNGQFLTHYILDEPDDFEGTIYFINMCDFDYRVANLTKVPHIRRSRSNGEFPKPHGVTHRTRDGYEIKIEDGPPSYKYIKVSTEYSHKCQYEIMKKYLRQMIDENPEGYLFDNHEFHGGKPSMAGRKLAISFNRILDRVRTINLGAYHADTTDYVGNLLAEDIKELSDEELEIYNSARWNRTKAFTKTKRGCSDNQSTNIFDESDSDSDDDQPDDSSHVMKIKCKVHNKSSKSTKSKKYSSETEKTESKDEISEEEQLAVMDDRIKYAALPTYIFYTKRSRKRNKSGKLIGSYFYIKGHPNQKTSMIKSPTALSKTDWEKYQNILRKLSKLDES